MAGLVPAIHALPLGRASSGLRLENKRIACDHGVDGRDKPGHDGNSM
jgi:hypothetical protein